MSENTTVAGIAAPLPLTNLDTDQIMPKQFLFGIDKSGLARGVLHDLRYDPSGSLRQGFVLNRPEYQGARILLAGANFGCGSSREHAVWGLQQAGFEAVIAPSFGEIFFDSCFENGLLPIALPVAELDTLAAEAAADELRVELERCEITAPSGRVIQFSVHPLQREALLSGRDSIELTLSREPEIEAFQLRDRELRPWVYELDDQR